ncbi:MAG: ATP-grasp domain-containing protein [Candidatus Calescibacterium sp.]|nr:ATP-grasp domain-containing protein [Candidatus Calescibacterium sp.]MDW8195545.1 ATP-grasp domain-containing protein [Candidatus Calescibacterium sp.]
MNKFVKGIVVFADSNDDNATTFFNKAKSMGINTIFIDTKRLSIDYDIFTDMNSIKFLSSDAKRYSYFVRAVNLVPLNPFAFSNTQKFNEYRNYYSLMFSFLEILRSWNTKVVNPPSTFWCHYFKPYVYVLAKSYGMDIPQTFVTPSFREIYKIYKNYKNSNKKIIFKPIAGGKTVKILDDSNIENFKICGDVYIFQELIHGQNFRVFTLGNEYLCSLALEYDTSKAIDYRDLDPKEVKVKIIEVPDDIKKKSVKLANGIGLYFSGIDFIFNQQGYYFLDINPAPMFVGFEYHSGFPIIEKIIDYLLYC